MKSNGNDAFIERIADGQLIDEALERSVAETFLRHKLLGHPVVVSQDGEIEWIAPEEIPVRADDVSRAS